MIACKQWSDCGLTNGGCCALNLYGGRPSRGICEKVCAQKESGASPSLARKARTLVGATRRAGGALLAGGKVLVSSEEQARRFSICQACDLFDRKKQTCTKCGCLVRFKKKLATEACPIARW